MTNQTTTDETAEAARLATMPPLPTASAVAAWIIEHTTAGNLTEATRVFNHARRIGAIEPTSGGLLAAGWQGTGVQP